MTHIDLTNERVSIRESVRKRVLLALLIWNYIKCTWNFLAWGKETM